MPYLAHVKKLSKSWKQLEQLLDFMEVGTTPLQWPLFEGDERKRRIAKTKITFIEYRSELKPKVTPIITDTKLEQTLNERFPEEPGPPPLRLFVVEDLSQRVIELLGHRFDIDPLFFREHIADYVWYNVRDAWAMPSSLLASKFQRSWFQLRNVRLRYHHDQKDFEAARQDANTWNVLRRPDNDFNHWNYKDEHEGEDEPEEIVGTQPGDHKPIEGKKNDVTKTKLGYADERQAKKGEKPKEAVVSIIRTRTTIWIGKDKEPGGGTVGVVLLDPTLKQGMPLWHDRTNWLPTLTMEELARREADELAESAPSDHQLKSWYDDIVRMTVAYPWLEAAHDHKIDAQVLAYPTLYTICAEWLVVCDYVKTRLSQIEWEVEMPLVFRSKGDAIDSSLKRLHTWRRQIPVFRDMVKEARDHALPVAIRLTSNSETPKDKVDAFDDIKPDFERVFKALEELQDRADRLTDIVTAQINIQDSKQSIEDNHNLARLTWLATIFIPLSFVSAFFSMNESVSALKYTYGWFFLTAIPFTGVCLLIAQLAGGGALGQMTMKKEWVQKGSSFYEKHLKFK